MEIMTEILKNTSLWEILLLLAVIYLLFQPEFRKRITKITKIKIGDFELELQTLREEVQKGTEKIKDRKGHPLCLPGQLKPRQGPPGPRPGGAAPTH